MSARTRRVSLRARRALQTAAVVLAILIVWQVIILLDFVPSMVPSPGQVVAAILGLLVRQDFWAAAVQTLSAALIGWAIASVLGTVVGLLLGQNRTMQRAAAIVVDFGRSFPVLALLPVVILILGSNSRMKVVLVVLSCFWPVVIQAIQGSRRLDATVKDMVVAHRIPPLLAFFRVRLPSALPFISTGIRLAASMAILVSVGVEVLTQTPGMGREITLSQQTQQWDIAFAYLFFAGVLGWAIVLVLQKGEDRVLKWNRLSNG